MSPKSRVFCACAYVGSPHPRQFTLKILPASLNGSLADQLSTVCALRCFITSLGYDTEM